MKLNTKGLLSLCLCSLLWMSSAQAHADLFLRLVKDDSVQRIFINRVVEEAKRWSPQSGAISHQQLEEVRLAFNLSPRHPLLREKLFQMWESQIEENLIPQEKELAYTRLMILAPRNQALRSKLSDLLYSKHGKVSVAQVQRSHTLLNEAFDLWDQRKYEQSLRLFRQAFLPQSSEFAVLLAQHLRDRGHIKEARRILEGMQKQPDYLSMRQGMLERIRSAEGILHSESTLHKRLEALLELGQLSEAETALKALPDSAMKHWWRAKLLEKQARYHEAAAEYQRYYRQKWSGQLPHMVAVVYKVQMEDLNSLDLVALKFRTAPELLRRVNENLQQDWLETFRMVIVPMPHHGFSWPAVGYVSSHFGYRLHPIRATWRLHEGLDIETLDDIPATAAAAGQVVQRGYDKACGNMVRVQHNPQLQTVYCHGKKILIAQGSQVKPGQTLMITGNTGASASNHLHFGVRWQGQYTDPMDWL